MGEPGERSRYSDWLPTGRPRGRSWSPGRGKNFLFSMSFHTGSGFHLATYPVGTGDSFPKGKASGALS
jgi:hypothetical protein